MSKETKYDTIKDFMIENFNHNLLISDIKDFENRKLKQEKSGLYVILKIKCSNCDNIFERSYNIIKRNKNHCLCYECLNNKRNEKKRRNKESINEICEKANIKMTSYYKDKDIYKISGFCSCGENLKDINLICIKNSINNKDEKYHCEKCKIKYLHNINKSKYEDIYKEFEDNFCKLLTTYEEYESMNCSSKNFKFKFIAKCGHFYSTTIYGFRNSKHLCHECSILYNSSEYAYNWKGGYNSEKTKFRKTYEFKNFVKQVLKRDAYTCQICDKKSSRLNVHHLDGYNWCVDKRTDINNGITLCEECHNMFHTIYGRGNNTLEQFEDYKIILDK